MSGVKCGYLEYRNAEKVPADAAIALDIATSCIQKLVLLEDMQGCLMLEKETEALIASLPEDCFDRREIVLPLFISFANRSAMWASGTMNWPGFTTAKLWIYSSHTPTGFRTNSRFPLSITAESPCCRIIRMQRYRSVTGSCTFRSAQFSSRPAPCF